MPSKPSKELKHFTDRDDEQKRLRDLLQLDTSHPLPALNFYGVGGVGKSWLRRRMQQILRDEFPKVKNAYIDFDTRSSGGGKYIIDPSEAWFAIAKQLKIPCPYFLLAYAVMQSKQNDTPIEQKNLSQGEISKLKLAEELAKEWLGSEEAKAVTHGIPLLGLVPLVVRRGMDKAAEKRLKNDPDFQELDAMDYTQIYQDLLSRLIEDLNDYTPKEGKQCHSVIFLDTFEELRDETNKAHQGEHEDWVRQLARGVKRTLMIIFGQNRLMWDANTPAKYWKQAQNLEQHIIKSLSEDDARIYLQRCEITDRTLQDEVLKDSSCAPDPGYFPWTLGLCGDTLWQMREDRDDNTFPPAHEFRFEEGEHGPAAVVNRFLRKLPDVRRLWIERLAVTLRFDADAARNAFFVGDDERAITWERLREFSFLVPHPTAGWFSLHSHMRKHILEILSTEIKQEANHHWQRYWQNRAEGREKSIVVNEYAGLTWYHQWHLDPKAALDNWNAIAEGLRSKTAMSEHLVVVRWLTPLRAEPPISVLPEYARMLVCYGDELVKASLGNRSHNLHDSIDCYDQALNIFTRDKFPQEWASTQNNKGSALANLRDGDRAENLHTAIACFDLALKERTREKFPQEWALTQNNKGVTYSDRLHVDPAENLHKAITCYDHALEEVTRDRFPQLWAALQHNKGAALAHLLNSDRTKNLHKAIACFDLALKERTRDKFSQEWAMTQNARGVALADLPDGDRVQNLQKAIASYDLALEEYTRDKFPQEWAMTQYNKGATLQYLLDDDRVQNLHKAIACYDLALEERVRYKYPLDWAETQNNKGVALTSLLDGDLVKNLHDAIDCYDQALEERTRGKYPLDWAETQNNKGAALTALLDGDRAKNLHDAIDCYDQAMKEYTRDKYPQQWAGIQTNKGGALAALYDGDRTKSLHNAIDCYNQALRVVSRDAFPQDWATTLHNKALAFVDLNNLEHALSCLESAMEGFREIGNLALLERVEKFHGELIQRIAKGNASES